MAPAPCEVVRALVVRFYMAFLIGMLANGALRHIAENQHWKLVLDVLLIAMVSFGYWYDYGRHRSTR